MGEGVPERQVLLGNISAALPSATKLLQENGVVSVLSILDFVSKGAISPQLEEMKKVFRSEDSSLLKKTILHNNIAYHLINVADVSTPHTLKYAHKTDPALVLFEASHWINESLKYGNVLVCRALKF